MDAPAAGIGFPRPVVWCARYGGSDMAAAKFVTIEELQKRGRETYAYETKLGAFELRRLTHAQVRMLNDKYSKENRIDPFEDFKDEIFCMVCVTPAFTPESLAEFADDEGVVTEIALHAGRKHGILSTPPEDATPGKKADAPTSS